MFESFKSSFKDLSLLGYQPTTIPLTWDYQPPDLDIFEQLNVNERLNQLSTQTFSESIPQSKKITFLMACHNFLGKNPPGHEVIFLRALLSPQLIDASSVYATSSRIRIPNDKINELLQRAAYSGLIDISYDNPSPKKRFITGLLLASLSRKALEGTSVKELPTHHSLNPLRINSLHHMHNCPDSEPKMRSSIDANALLLVNGFLLVKSFGYKTGYCIQTTSTTEGTFFEGAWYTPNDEVSKDKIRTSLENKEKHLKLTEGEWNYVRDSSKFLNNDEFWEFNQRVKTAVSHFKTNRSSYS